MTKSSKPPVQRVSYSVSEFAQATGISNQGVRDLIFAGRIRAKRLNPDLELRSKYLIPAAELDRWFDELPDA